MDSGAVLGVDDGRGSCDSILCGGYKVLDRGSAQGGGITGLGAGDDGGDLPVGGSSGAPGADGDDNVVGLNGGFLGTHNSSVRGGEQCGLGEGGSSGCRGGRAPICEDGGSLSASGNICGDIQDKGGGILPACGVASSRVATHCLAVLRRETEHDC
jgi:hypothetical protein